MPNIKLQRLGGKGENANKYMEKDKYRPMPKKDPRRGFSCAAFSICEYPGNRSKVIAEWEILTWHYFIFNFTYVYCIDFLQMYR